LKADLLKIVKSKGQFPFFSLFGMNFDLYYSMPGNNILKRFLD